MSLYQEINEQLMKKINKIIKLTYLREKRDIFCRVYDDVSHIKADVLRCTLEGNESIMEIRERYQVSRKCTTRTCAVVNITSMRPCNPTSLYK